jgi:hypothetical protein
LETLDFELHSGVGEPLDVVRPWDCDALASRRRGDGKERKKSEEKSIHLGTTLEQVWVFGLQEVLLKFCEKWWATEDRTKINRMGKPPSMCVPHHLQPLPVPGYNADECRYMVLVQSPQRTQKALIKECVFFKMSDQTNTPSSSS